MNVQRLKPVLLLHKHAAVTSTFKVFSSNNTRGVKLAKRRQSKLMLHLDNAIKWYTWEIINKSVDSAMHELVVAPCVEGLFLFILLRFLVPRADVSMGANIASCVFQSKLSNWNWNSLFSNRGSQIPSLYKLVRSQCEVLFFFHYLVAADQTATVTVAEIGSGRWCKASRN